MSTNFPGALDSYTNKVDGVDTVQAAHVNNLQDAVVAVETLIGATPTTGWQNVSSYGANITADAAGGVQVRRIGRVVYIRGGIKATGAVSAYSTVFSLPAGYAPAAVDAHLATRYAGSETFRQVAVNTGGAGIAMHSMATNDVFRVTGSWLID